jgi:hypothetical protein
MTTTLILIASLVGAVLFFVAGAAMMALRQQPQPRAVPALQPPTDGETEVETITRLRYALDDAEATVQRQVGVIEEQNRLLERDVTNDRAGVARDMQALRERADRAEAISREAKRLRDEGAAKLRAEAELLRADAERLQKEAVAASAANHELRRIADDRGQQLERARTDFVAATTEIAQLESKLRDIERQLADKVASTRDLSTENEQLKGRLRDADALRAEYVRLRTATTDSDYLKSEIARLEQELRAVRVDALGARGAQLRPRPARGTDRQPTTPERTIGESLARVIERFADAGTRSSALSDTQGFPLASSGTDGVALAAYAAHLFESASRAKEYLPVGAPSAIEIVDTNGVRVSVWSLDIDADRLMLANLAVSPVDSKRVETTLGDLGQILAPSGTRATAHT